MMITVALGQREKKDTLFICSWNKSMKRCSSRINERQTDNKNQMCGVYSGEV